MTQTSENSSRFRHSGTAVHIINLHSLQEQKFFSKFQKVDNISVQTFNCSTSQRFLQRSVWPLLAVMLDLPSWNSFWKIRTPSCRADPVVGVALLCEPQEYRFSRISYSHFSSPFFLSSPHLKLRHKTTFQFQFLSSSNHICLPPIPYLLYLLFLKFQVSVP